MEIRLPSPTRLMARRNTLCTRPTKNGLLKLGAMALLISRARECAKGRPSQACEGRPRRILRSHHLAERGTTGSVQF